MKKNISPNDCKAMFADKFSSLSMKELGIELKHFAIGTAPEYPSFLANQDDLKKVLIEKFTNFFDHSRSQGLEIIFLKSNYGNGKSHFLRTIRSFLNNFENVLTKQVSLKQEKTDLKTKVLEAVGQKTIKDCATHFVNIAADASFADEKDSILLTLSEKLEIDSILSELLYQAARSEDISKQSQAIAILKGNHLQTYLKSFNFKQKDLGSAFYLNVIRLICDYLYENNYYLVIMLDEFEHVYSWKDMQARKSFFEDIKLFYDCIDTYRNLFFVFGESESASSESVSSDDPAYLSRKKGQTYQIENISSETEVQKLFKMIKTRYEKYYEVSLEAFVDDILEAINNDPQVKTNSNYREYTKCIMRILDQYRNHPPKARKVKKISNDAITSANKDVIVANRGISFADKWISATSISKKTILCDAIEYILKHSNEKIISKSRKKGFYQTQKQEDIIEYQIIATDNPSSSDFIKRYNEALRIQEESDVVRSIILYPYKQGTNDEFKYENVIFYNVDGVPEVLDQIYAKTENIEDVFSYLRVLETRC
jgi:Protein of unknown function (DUF2791).